MELAPSLVPVRLLRRGKAKKKERRQCDQDMNGFLIKCICLQDITVVASSPGLAKGTVIVKTSSDGAVHGVLSVASKSVSTFRPFENV